MKPPITSSEGDSVSRGEDSCPSVSLLPPGYRSVSSEAPEAIVSEADLAEGVSKPAAIHRQPASNGPDTAIPMWTTRTAPTQSRHLRNTAETRSMIQHLHNHLKKREKKMVPKEGVESPRGCPQRILSSSHSDKVWTRPRTNGNDFEAVRVPRATLCHCREPLKAKSTATEASKLGTYLSAHGHNGRLRGVLHTIGVVGSH
jgi:hypothetical protein